MDFNIPSISLALPEMIVLGGACLVILLSVYYKSNRAIYLITQLTLLLAAFSTAADYNAVRALTFDNSFIVDHFAVLLKVFIYITSFASFVYARKYIEDRGIDVAEFYALGLFTVLGMMVIVSAYSLLTLYLGLELFSFPLYAMIAMQRNSALASEAAIKYFVMGAIASGMMLYGMSMLYGATSSLDLSIIAHKIALTPLSQDLVFTFGLVFLVAGIVFKFGAVPFHMWVPDVYHGAATPITAFIGSAPKIAALALAMRLLVQALPSLHGQWQEIFVLVAFLSMALGNIIAIAQTNIKRMLAYSSIAHMGYMSLGLLAQNDNGYASAIFYMIMYAIMSVGAFGMVVLLSRSGFEADKIDDFKGLNARSPWMAFIMLLLMFSMAGIPPTVGFFAKMGVLEALIRVHYEWLAVFALLFAVIGAYYYLRIVKVMYFEDPVDTNAIECSMDMRLMLSINGLVVLILGIVPSGMIQWCRAVLFNVG